MRFLIFGLIFLLVMAAANYYIYRRFFCRLAPELRRYAPVIPIILMVGELVFIADAALNLIPDSPTWYFINSAFIGITFMLFVVATVYDLTVTVSSRVPFDQERRRFIKIVFDVTMLVAAFSYLLRGFSQGVKDPRINTVPVAIKDFPMDDYTIVQLTDIHVGRTIRRDFMERSVARVNAMNPDMVVITGDLVDLPVSRIRQDLEPLRDLKAPVYFILGNHEYFHGAQAVLDHVRTLGIRPLLNESVQIGNGKQRFNLIGLADLVGLRMDQMPPDPERAWKQVDESLPCVVLSHQPKSLPQTDGRRCDLMLSGHTHGGQIFPFGLLVMVDQPYLAGLHRHDEHRQIFVSRGTGYWGPPLRVLAPSEISKIVIRPA